MLVLRSRSPVQSGVPRSGTGSSPRRRSQRRSVSWLACGVTGRCYHACVAKKSKTGAAKPSVGPRSAPWRIHFFRRHAEDDATQAVPGRDFLERCLVAPRMAAVLKAVAEAPPNVFAGGGYWEAMRGSMAGYYEVRIDGRDRHHYRLFCILERDGRSSASEGRASSVITGMEKPFRTTFQRTRLRPRPATGERVSVARTVVGAPVTPWTFRASTRAGAARRPPLGTSSRMAAQCGHNLEHGADGRVPTCVGQQATDNLGFDGDAARDLCLRDPAARPGALERTDEGIGRGDLGTRDLELPAEGWVAELLIEESVEPGLGRHRKRNIYATNASDNPRRMNRSAEGPGLWAQGSERQKTPGHQGLESGGAGNRTRL